MRPIVWHGEISNGATSCHILSDVEIQKGERKIIEIVLLNQLEIRQPIYEGIVLSIGSTSEKIVGFTVMKHLGLWKGTLN